MALQEDKLYVLLKQFEARLNALEDSVNNTLIGGLKEAANKYIDDENYGAFGEKYGAMIDEVSPDLAIINGEDFDARRSLYDKIKEINLNMEIVSQYDMVFAKSKFSQNNNCITPKINNHGYIKIIKGKHPLLKGNVVPLDFEIGNKYRSLIITGPNAGGKTVTLKTVGLLTLMTQCGFDIPAMENSEIAIFEKIFVDIGDNQSIENALSTFSSHIKNIAEIMREANKNTLVLFDEIGSGTDPNEGASLAIALLEEFYQMGCITIASTHYEEIKHFANKHPHFENAGMMFDKETLEPLYKLTIGKSEDSNALFISKKWE